MPTLSMRPALWALFSLTVLMLLVQAVSTVFWFNLRAVQLLALPAVLFCLWPWKKPAAPKLPPMPFWLPFTLIALWSAWVLISSYYRLFFNGVDYSIFDWMVHSSHTGHGGYSPIYNVNHYGQHSTFSLWLLHPLHAVWESAQLLLVVNWLQYVGIGVVWYRIARQVTGQHELSLWFMLVALTNPWTLRQLTSGYMPEYGFTFLYGLVWLGLLTDKRWLFWLGVGWLLCTKEDAALYLAMLGVALLVQPRWNVSRVRALSLVVLCGTFFLVYTRVIQPTLLAETGITRPSFLSFWNKHGETMGAIVADMLKHPVVLLTDIWKSRWYELLGPVALAPMFTLHTALPIAFGLFFLGSSNYPMMRVLGHYYPLPMVAFVLVGTLLTPLPKVLEKFRPQVLALLGTLFMVVGGDAPRLLPFSVARHDGLRAAVRAQVEQHPERQVFLLSVYFPQVGYEQVWRPLFSLDECRQANGVALVSLVDSTYPLEPKDLKAWIDEKAAQGRARHDEALDTWWVDCGSP